MAIDPLLGNNHQGTPIPDDIVAHVFDRRVPQISFSVKTGEWAMSTPVERELTSRYLKQIAKNICKATLHSPDHKKEPESVVSIPSQLVSLPRLYKYQFS